MLRLGLQQPEHCQIFSIRFFCNEQAARRL